MNLYQHEHFYASNDDLNYSHDLHETAEYLAKAISLGQTFPNSACCESKTLGPERKNVKFGFNHSPSKTKLC